MKAIVNTQYGSQNVMQLKEVAKPTPNDNQVLVKIHATSVNAADWHLLRASPFLVRFEMGLFKPKYQTFGADIAGRVEAVGKSVTRFKVGDAVFGDLSSSGFGGFAEYAAVPEHVLVLKPTQLTFEEAAAVPMAAVTALNGLREKGQIKAGQKVLINGASGGVGTFAVQLAKYFGAKVTAVCSSKKVEMVRSLGADHVIDYTQENFTQNGQQYDLIIAANGYHPIRAYKRALTPQGKYVVTGGTMGQIFEAMILGPLLSSKNGKQLTNVLSKSNAAHLTFISELIDAGKVKPIIDRCYPLSETAEALRYVEAGHAQGKVVIRMEGNS